MGGAAAAAGEVLVCLGIVLGVLICIILGIGPLGRRVLRLSRRERTNKQERTMSTRRKRRSRRSRGRRWKASGHGLSFRSEGIRLRRRRLTRRSSWPERRGVSSFEKEEEEEEEVLPLGVGCGGGSVFCRCEGLLVVDVSPTDPHGWVTSGRGVSSPHPGPACRAGPTSAKGQLGTVAQGSLGELPSSPGNACRACSLTVPDSLAGQGSGQGCQAHPLSGRHGKNRQ